jgi:hypothetical protein
MCGVPRFNYLARTTHPSVLLPAASEFDRLMFSIVQNKFELPILRSTSSNSNSSNNTTTYSTSSAASIAMAYTQLTLPIRFTGLGLRSTVDSLDVAYLASIVRAVYEDPKWWKDNGPTENNNFGLYLQWQDTIDMVAQKLPGRKHRHLYPVDTNIGQFIERVEVAKHAEKQRGKNKTPSASVHGPSDQPNLTRLQSELSTAIAKLKLAELFQLCVNPTDVNRLKCLSNPTSDAHVWLSAIPSDRTLIMSSDAMKHAIRYRLGLQPYDTMPSQCVYCK